MVASGRAWVEQLPPELARQRRLLEGLLKLCETDDDISWLMIGCSFARGRADSLSDLDLAMGVEEEEYDAVRMRVRSAIGDLGDLVDSFHHQFAGLTPPHERIFAQFADRSQIDLVVVPASRSSFGEHSIALYDPGRCLNLDARQPPATPEMAREWAFLSCCALADIGKYLRRKSPWEALERLNEARTHLWRLVALERGIPDPWYGVTSVLDFAPDQLPADMTETVSSLDYGRLLSAGRRAALLLGETGGRLPEDAREMFPARMVRYVTEDLESLQVQSR